MKNKIIELVTYSIIILILSTAFLYGIDQEARKTTKKSNEQRHIALINNGCYTSTNYFCEKYMTTKEKNNLTWNLKN